jgi:hypothetical protein
MIRFIKWRISSKLMNTKLQALLRVIWLISIVSFLLPFLTVKGCQTKVATQYSGYQLFSEEQGWILAIPLAAAFAYFLLSYRKSVPSLNFKGFVQTWNMFIAAAFAFLIGVLPSIMFLFDDVKHLSGQVLAASCWLLQYITYAIQITLSMIKPPAERRDSAAVLSPKRKTITSFIYIILTLLICLPLAEIIFNGFSSESFLNAFYFLIVFTAPGVLMMYYLKAGIAAKENFVSSWGSAGLLGMSGLCILCGIGTATATDWPWLFLLAPIAALGIVSGFRLILLRNQ